MHRARAFFYVCAGLFLLALSYHLGARNATAQSGSSVTGITMANVGCGAELFVVTGTGDVFKRPYACGGLTGSTTLIGNFWGSPTAAQQSTFGAVKSRYRGERGAAQPAPQGR